MEKRSEPRLVRLGRYRWRDVAALQRRCFENPWDPGTVREVMEGALCRGLGVENSVSGILVAYALYAVQRELCHLIDLGVTPGWRRRGVGSGLVEAVIEQARAASASTVFLEVREQNTAARALYERLGFTRRGRRPRYYPDTDEDALVLMRDLP